MDFYDLLEAEDSFLYTDLSNSYHQNNDQDYEQELSSSTNLHNHSDAVTLEQALPDIEVISATAPSEPELAYLRPVENNNIIELPNPNFYYNTNFLLPNQLLNNNNNTSVTPVSTEPPSNSTEYLVVEPCSPMCPTSPHIHNLVQVKKFTTIQELTVSSSTDGPFINYAQERVQMSREEKTQELRHMLSTEIAEILDKELRKFRRKMKKLRKGMDTKLQLKRVSSNTFLVDQGSTVKAKHKCIECHNMFVTKASLIAHHKTHEQFFCYICCTFSTDNSFSLRQHILEHKRMQRENQLETVSKKCLSKEIIHDTDDTMQPINDNNFAMSSSSSSDYHDSRHTVPCPIIIKAKIIPAENKSFDVKYDYEWNDPYKIDFNNYFKIKREAQDDSSNDEQDDSSDESKSTIFQMSLRARKYREKLCLDKRTQNVMRKLPDLN